jgi:hypothetical protein
VKNRQTDVEMVLGCVAVKRVYRKMGVRGHTFLLFHPLPSISITNYTLLHTIAPPIYRKAGRAQSHSQYEEIRPSRIASDLIRSAHCVKFSTPRASDIADGV